MSTNAWRSMTGFGEAVEERDGWRIEIQARAVNLKGLDVRVRSQPRDLAIEHAVARVFTTRLQRGKVEVQLQMQRSDDGGLVADSAALQRWRAQRVLLRLRAGVSDLPLPFATGEAGGLPAVEAVGAVAEACVQALDADRATEGAGLHALAVNQLGEMADRVADLRRLRESERDLRVADVRERLAAWREFGLDPADERRLQEEVGLLLMRSDNAEELDRLDLHLRAVRELLTQPSPVGRKLDVLAQEIGREAHTATAKAVLPEARQAALELRSVVEQLREQVQNIE